MKKLFAGIAIACVIAPVSAMEVITNLLVSDTTFTQQGPIGTVTGVVTNTTDKKLASVTVTFALLNGKSVQVGTALATGVEVDPGKPWKFSAVGMAQTPFISAKLMDVKAVAE
jgi:hypothetical protein